MRAFATFGAGCFWGVEQAFGGLDGVLATSVGFAGGRTKHPTYEQVCAGGTGHAEAVRVEYDPDRLPYEKLLELFWDIHDPTTLDRQGPDVGDQYRSVIFFHDAEQEREARASLHRQECSGRYGRPVVTRLEPVGEFTLAEEFHQRYLEKRGLRGCSPPKDRLR